MLAAIELKLILLLVFVIISALSSWMKKKQNREEEERPAPPARRPRPASIPPSEPRSGSPKPMSWEEELRRLLEGEVPATPSAPPPPVVVQSRHPAPPPPLPEAAQHKHRSVFEVTEESSPMDVDVQPHFQPLRTLSESVQAYEQASHLDRKVQAHLREVTERPIGTTSVQRKGSTSEAAAALALLRNPKSVRSAILVSMILGPPKALAD